MFSIKPILVFFVLSMCAAGNGFAGECDLDRADLITTISYIHDGDTVFTDNQRKIRLIGLDTPELAQDRSPAEPFAEKARDYLVQLLGSSSRIQLRFDEQKQDRYRRDLAHLFLDSGENVTQHLLKAGLATALIMPPNLMFADCYLAAQKRAREQRLGIWRLPAFQPITLLQFDPSSAPSYRLITASVASMQQRGDKYQILLRDRKQRLTVLIKNQKNTLFDELLNELWIGRRVLVQGWINKRRGRLQMRLQHPGFITPLTDPL